MWKLKACLSCHGAVYQDGKRWYCINCGREMDKTKTHNLGEAIHDLAYEGLMGATMVQAYRDLCCDEKKDITGCWNSSAEKDLPCSECKQNASDYFNDENGLFNALCTDYLNTTRDKLINKLGIRGLI